MIESNLLPMQGSSNEMQNFTLSYFDKQREKNYRQLSNSRFGYDIITTMIIFALIGFLQMIVLGR